MMTDTLLFPHQRASVATGPDVAVAALPLFRRLRFELDRARQIRDRQDALAGRWAAPPAVFLHDAPPPPRPASLPAELMDRVTDARCVLRDHLVRNAARTVPGLTQAVARWPEVPTLRDVATMLAMLDEAVIHLRVPTSQATVRVLVRGVATIGQLVARLLECSPAGVLPTPGIRLVHPRAERRSSANLDAPESALDWFWPEQPIRRLPRGPNGEWEALVVAGRPPVAGSAPTDVLPEVVVLSPVPVWSRRAA